MRVRDNYVLALTPTSPHISPIFSVLPSYIHTAIQSATAAAAVHGMEQSAMVVFVVSFGTDFVIKL